MNAEVYLERCFELARKGLGTTWPNPLVGAVIVKEGRIIGEGFHRKSGEDHAEADALKNCTESPAGATIYVNLEPCCHTNKKTPPCAQRLIREKVAKVVISNLDPNPEVSGKGVELLRENGIEVEYGALAQEGEKLNEVFFHAQRTRSPFVHLKLASTLDGKIALPSGESQWITGEEARHHVHYLRSCHQAIMIGAGTLRADDPQLNVRLPLYQGEQPIRIVFSTSGELPSQAKLFHDENRSRTIVYSHNKTSLNLPAENQVQIKNLQESMQDLFERNICSVLLEGGGKIAASFMQEKLIQRITLYQNPSFLGAGQNVLSDFGVEKLNQRPRLIGREYEWIGDDLMITGRIK